MKHNFTKNTSNEDKKLLAERRLLVTRELLQDQQIGTFRRGSLILRSLSMLKVAKSKERNSINVKGVGVFKEVIRTRNVEKRALPRRSCSLEKKQLSCPNLSKTSAT